LEDHVRSLPLLVVLPSLDNSLGLDTASGEWYEQFFVEELMAYVEATGTVKHGPENTAVAGAGAGGYAALRLALAYPYWFGTVVSHSAEVYAAQENRVLELPGGEQKAARYRQVFGAPDDPRRKHGDLFRLTETLAPKAPPEILLDCGTEDPLLPHNRDFRRRLSQLRVRHDYLEPKGGHDWEYWDQRLQASLPFIAKSLAL
jgi:S-formylglutathione hydrolase FrmB